MYVLGSLKSFFQLVHKVDTSLYLIEPTLQLCYKELAFLTGPS